MANDPVASPGIGALRTADPDRYLATLYAPADKRDALATLHAFNAEIAAIRDRIHEPMPGEIRIQWWRDALAGGRDAASGHPLATALIGVMERHALPLSAFDRYLEARIFDLYDDPMPSRTDLEGYCGETSSTMIQLAALVLDPQAASKFAAAAGHAGCAVAIAGMVRQLPLHRRRGQCFFPQDVLAAAGTDRDALIAGQDRDATGRAVQAMVALGRDHFARFTADAAGMPASLRSAFLPAALAPAYLDAATRRGFAATDAVADIGPLRKHGLLLYRAMRGW